jgi:hypothetical protein
MDAAGPAGRPEIRTWRRAAGLWRVPDGSKRRSPIVNVNVTEVSCPRMMEQNGRPAARVELMLANPPGQKLTAVIARSEEGEYMLTSVQNNDADLIIDWFDNSMHNAYTDITDQYTEEGKRDLLRQILAAEGMEAELSRQFAEA